jgi:hypothetical protein
MKPAMRNERCKETGGTVEFHAEVRKEHFTFGDLGPIVLGLIRDREAPR